MDDATQEKAAAFAVHLRERSNQAARELARVLAEHGEERRADFLRAFVNEGSHSSPATWWTPETVCHVSLLLPSQMRTGDLWFDPLEVTWSLAVPWIRDPRVPEDVYEGMPDFCYWFALESVSDWQLRGAHDIAPDVASSRAVVSGDNAWRYSKLFGKTLTSWTTWGMLGKAYDLDVVLRLWGDSVGEVGLGGADDHAAHIIALDNIVRVKDPDGPFPQETGDRTDVGVDFRPTLNLQYGLAEDDEALERIWHS